MNDGSFLSQVKGFTPVIDVLAKEMELMTAAVYGVVWRYCQMEDGVCSASHETIAEHLNIDRRTVMRHLETLCAHGYLRDLTPEYRNKPHTYADSGKVKIIGLVEARISTEGGPAGNESGVTESHSKPGRCDRKSQRGVTESHLKKEGKKGKDMDPFEGHDQNPMAGLPRGVDGHQRAVDRASGGQAPDPVEDAAKHLYMGFMGGPVPMPRAKKEREKWMQAAQRLLQRLPDGWELRAVCEAIDRWWANTPEDDEFWKKMPCKDETLDLIARYYITYQQRLASSRQTSDDAAEDGGETVEVETMSPEEERRRALDKLWGSVLGELQLQTTKATFDTWIRQTQIVGHDGNGTYTVQAQNSFAMDWLENRLKGTVERTMGGILHKPVEVRFVLAGYVTKSNEL